MAVLQPLLRQSVALDVPFLTRSPNKYHPLTVEVLPGGGSARSSILTAPLLDGKLLRLGSWAAWSAAVSERRQARESRQRRLDGQYSFSSNRLRPQYAMSSRRREGGWRRNPMAWPRSSVEDLGKEAGRSVQAHAAKPWSHVGCCHHPLSTADLLLSNHNPIRYLFSCSFEKLTT